MKKILFSMVCLMMMGTAATKAQTAQIALQHKGNITMFGSTQTQEALDKAEDGDTLFLNEGSFKSDIFIRKKISIIGSGENTLLPGDIHIAIPDSATLTQYLLDALYITGTIYIDSAVNGLKMRKCQLYAMEFNAKTDKSFVERCYIKQNVNQNDNLVGVSFHNSKIGRITGDANAISSSVYTNCNVKQIDLYNYYNGSYWARHHKGSYFNCIISKWVSNPNYSMDGSLTATYTNCLDGSNGYSNTINQNCYTYTQEGEQFSLLDDNIECSLPTDSLKEKGYLGTDGTVVGIYGGAIPYTLAPSMPRVTEHNIVVDTDKKKLNVTLKVTAK